MASDRHVFSCESCGYGYLDVDACPRCDTQSMRDDSRLRIPWFRSKSGWSQVRLDGTNWSLVEGIAVVSPVGTGTPEIHECGIHDRIYMGTADAPCPECAVVSSTEPPSRRHGTAKKATLVIVLLVLAVAAGIWAITLVPSPTATTTTIVVAVTTTLPPTTKSTVPVDSEEFLAGIAFETSMVSIAAEAEQSENRVLEANALWDNRDITQDEAFDLFTEEIDNLSGIIDTLGVVASVAIDPSHIAPVASAAIELRDAVEAIQVGLMTPGSRSLRDDATSVSVFKIEEMLNAVDESLVLNRQRLIRSPGTPIRWTSVRLGDCVDVDQQDDATEIVDCSTVGRGEVLAYFELPPDIAVESHMCVKMSLGSASRENFTFQAGTWLIKETDRTSPSAGYNCTFIPASGVTLLLLRPEPRIGPFVSDQWAALDRLDLVPDRFVEAGQCFDWAPEGEDDWLARQYAVACESNPDVSVPVVLAVALPVFDESIDRFTTTIQRTCEAAVDAIPGSPPYPSSEVTTFAVVPDFLEYAAMTTLACVTPIVYPSYDRQAGYADGFLMEQEGLYDFGLIENPQTVAELEYNEAFMAGAADVAAGMSPSLEMIDEEWIEFYLVGNPEGWSNGRQCERPNPYPVPADIEGPSLEGWYAGFNAGWESACDTGKRPSRWVGRSTCPYDPWEVAAIDQDIVCPPVRP